MAESVKIINFRKYAITNHWNQTKLKKPLAEPLESDDPVLLAITNNNEAQWQRCRSNYFLFPCHFYYVLSHPEHFNWFLNMMYTQNFHLGNQELVQAISSNNKPVLSWAIKSKYIRDPRILTLYAVQLTNFSMLDWLIESFGTTIIHDAVQLILVQLGCTNTLQRIIDVQGIHLSGLYESIRLDILDTMTMYFTRGYNNPLQCYEIAIEHDATECLKWLREQYSSILPLCPPSPPYPPAPSVSPIITDSDDESTWIDLEKVLM